MLIMISGLPGTGKTTVAKAFSSKKNALHLNSDLIRRELGLMGAYQQEDKEAVYNALLVRTRAALLEGLDVVVDSTFYKASIREPFQHIAMDCHVPLCPVEVKASEAVIRDRLKTPRSDSEADFAVYQKIKNEAEPLTDPHLTLWSDKMSLEKMVADLEAYATALQEKPV